MKRIPKGRPLTELVKGSVEYTATLLHQAFRSQFRSEDAYWNWYIVETFADHVIVYDSQLPPDEYWQVAYEGSPTTGLFQSAAQILRFPKYDALKALAGPYVYQSPSGTVVAQLNSGLTPDEAKKFEQAIQSGYSDFLVENSLGT